MTGLRRAFLVGATAAIAAHPVTAQQPGTGVIQGKLVCRGVRDCGGAVVYLERIAGRQFPPGPPVIMDQVKLTFTPHVLPVMVGTRVEFPNSDEVRHNVFSPSAAKRFNLGTYPRGVTKYVVFDKPGLVELLCNVHADMAAYILVTETPFTTLADRDGSYTIKGVPPGAHRIRAWREQLKEQAADATVKPNETTVLNFELRR